MAETMNSPSYVEVAFPIPLNRAFHYEIPPPLRNGHAPALGTRVLAPFGKTQQLVGYVVGTTDDRPSFATKPIAAYLDDRSFVDAPLMALARWLSDRYLCSLGEALAAIMPA